VGERERVEAMRAALRDAGLRVTPTRLAVLAILRSAERSLSHQEIAAALAERGCDAVTVYRNLVTLVEHGLALRQDVGDHVWRFQAAERAARHEHPHFVCTACGALECVPELELTVKAKGSKVPRSVLQQAIEVQVRGICDACA
jgi:Fur family ferric uptake transcriptional regulator